MNEPRDALVGDALRRLDVPDHAPDFWDRLEASLSGDTSDAAADVAERDAEVIELGAARAGRTPRTTRSIRWPATAAAAAAVVAIALAVGLPAAQQADDGDSQVDVADAPVAPDPSAPVTSGPVATEPAPPSTATPEQVATEWLTLLRAGEVEQAHALLDDASQEALPLEELRAVGTALAEGAGAFAGVEPTVVPLIDDEGLAATAVVFTAELEREGMVETASFGVVVTGDPDDTTRRLGVGYVLDGPTVTADPTAPGETRTSPLEVTLSPTAGATWAIVDGSSPQRIDTSGTGTATIDVEAIAGAGTHTVTVISTEGGLYRSASFTVVVP